MSSLAVHIRKRAGVAVAVGVSVGLFLMSRPPQATSGTRAALASRFQFVRETLPKWGGRPEKFVRAVHPSLERISAWISAVGAAATLADLDGDGLPNDLCL